ncbi:MAG: D-alanyl-D-alanine carboxypeptidase family protein [Candidatus Pelethousia sp.]|nr:D-alanyl-D-alanine carboxypeptidase family protein [Candidatus Pelethousia sp.]
MRLIRGCLAALLALLFLLVAYPVQALSQPPETSARAALLMEATTGKVLYERNAQQKLPMASTTKVMTALLAIEIGNLDEMVTTDATAYGVEGSSIYLQMEETISLRDLVYGLMLASGNDAAVAIAVHIGHGIKQFAAMMNAKARQLGAVNTNFVTPNGLPNADHYTTAYDLTLIAAAAMQNETFREIVSTQYYRAETGAVVRTFKNKNKILWNYAGGNGVKTGYTKAAGRCLVFAAERDGMQLVGVVLDCPDMFKEAETLLDYGMNHYEMVPMVSGGDRVASIFVDGGMKNRLALCAAEDIMVPVEKNESSQYRTRVILPDSLAAPVHQGETCGYVEVLEENGALRTRFDLVAEEDIDEATVRFYIEKLARFLA